MGNIYLYLDTSSLFLGHNNKFTISDSLFQNITIKNSLPYIADSKLSDFTISNTEFKNMM